jgi:hypothetical protein
MLSFPLDILHRTIRAERDWGHSTKNNRTSTFRPQLFGQQLDDLGVAVAGCKILGSVTIDIANGRVSLMFQQKLDNFYLPFSGGMHQSCETLARIYGVDFGTGLEQHTDRVIVGSCRREHQCGSPIRISIVHCGALF